jgi:CRISPR/Cas system-associated protein Cas10 (large subunit of type III CRISPR-Cas system)
MKYLLKVDISGIQDFIFNVPGKGAARNLKGRSFFVHALTEIAESYFLEHFNGNKDQDVLYNGGGNLFIYLTAVEKVLKQEIEYYQSVFQGQSIFPFIAYVEVHESIPFKELMRQLNLEMNRKKLYRPVSFIPYVPENIHTQDEQFKSLTRSMVLATGYSINRNSRGAMFEITDDAIHIAGYSLILTKNEKPSYSFGLNVLNKLPLNANGQIEEFDIIAEKAKSRSVDDKLAALKIDVDNLGLLFRDQEVGHYKRISQAIQDFFSKVLYDEVLKQPVNSGDAYPVFAGGDDCFIIGAWDVILPLAIQIQERFDRFQKGLKNDNLIDHDITVSAGIVVCNPTYPLARMAEEAEHALELAKEYGKNRICIFGEVLQWKEYRDAQTLSGTLKALIDDGESRALLERIRSSEIGFRSLQQRAVVQNKIDFPKVYRLKYFLKNAKKDENRKKLDEAFQLYADALVEDFVKGKEVSNAAKFPVAARWAELLTK